MICLKNGALIEEQNPEIEKGEKDDCKLYVIQGRHVLFCENGDWGISKNKFNPGIPRESLKNTDGNNKGAIWGNFGLKHL